MVNTFETQTLVDTEKRTVVKLVGYFDGSGQETANTKVIGRSLRGALAVDSNNAVLVSQGGAPRTNYNMSINRVVSTIVGPGSIALMWTGSTPATALILSTGWSDINSQDDLGDIPNNAVGPTGNLVITTSGFVAQSAYSLILDIHKGPNQSNTACDFSMGQVTKPSDFNFQRYAVKP